MRIFLHFFSIKNIIKWWPSNWWTMDKIYRSFINRLSQSLYHVSTSMADENTTTQTTPIIPTPQAWDDIHLNLDFSSLSIPSSYIEALPTNESTNDTNIEEVKPTVITPPEAPKDDRLTKEDARVEEINPIKIDIPEETVPKETSIEKKEFDINTSNFKEDQKIIEELTNTQENRTEQLTHEIPTIKEEPIITNTVPTPAPAAMDLDFLLWTPTPPAPQTTETIIQNAPQETAGSTFQTTLPSITPPPQITNTGATITLPVQAAQRSGSKRIGTLVLILLLGGASFYVLKTMYPLEYNNLMTNVMLIMGQVPEDTTPAPTSIENIVESTGQTATQPQNTSWTQNPITGDANNNTWTTESGFNAFADLENILTGSTQSASDSQTQLTQLQKYSDEAKTFLDLGKKINDKIMMKYGLYVSKKADSLVQSIENKEAIDSIKVDSYLSQFSWYLHKLTTLSYDTSTGTTLDTTPTQPIIQTQTGEQATQGSGAQIPQTSSGETTNTMIEDVGPIPPPPAPIPSPQPQAPQTTIPSQVTGV